MIAALNENKELLKICDELNDKETEICVKIETSKVLPTKKLLEAGEK